MEFFDKLGKKATEAYKITADKTGKLAKETKLRLKINELRRNIEDAYEEIGKKVYESHLREEDFAKEEIKQEIEGLCVKIDVLSDEIEDLLEQCLELRDKKQCKNCFVEMDKEYKYCPNCGVKQDKEKDFEIDENEGNEEDKEEQENETWEKDEDNKENLENLEKTVIVESNVDNQDRKIEEVNNDKIDNENSEDDDIQTY